MDLESCMTAVQAISSLLDLLLQNLSEDVQHIVECIAGGHPSAVAVSWHVRARSSSLLHAKVSAEACICICICPKAHDMTDTREVGQPSPCYGTTVLRLQASQSNVTLAHRASRS